MAAEIKQQQEEEEEQGLKMVRVQESPRSLVARILRRLGRTTACQQEGCLLRETEQAVQEAEEETEGGVAKPRRRDGGTSFPLRRPVQAPKGGGGSTGGGGRRREDGFRGAGER